jgi:hypothetical protein
MCTKSAFSASGPASWSSAWGGAATAQGQRWDVGGAAAAASGLGALPAVPPGSRVLSSMIVPGTMLPATSAAGVSMPAMANLTSFPVQATVGTCTGGMYSGTYWFKRSTMSPNQGNIDWFLTKVPGTVGHDSWMVVGCDTAQVPTSITIDNVTRIAALKGSEVQRGPNVPGTYQAGEDAVLVERVDSSGNKTLLIYYPQKPTSGGGPTTAASFDANYILNLQSFIGRLQGHAKTAAWLSILVAILVIILLIWIVWAIFRRK